MKRRRGLKVVPFKKAKVEDETGFIDTLVWVLEQARAGKIKTYAMVFEVEDKDKTRSIESANFLGTGDTLHVLGMIERMKVEFMKRNWPE